MESIKINLFNADEQTLKCFRNCCEYLDDELGSLYQNYDPLFGIKFNELSDSPKFAEEFGTEGSSKLGVDVLIFESAEDFSIWCLKFSG